MSKRAIGGFQATLAAGALFVASIVAVPSVASAQVTLFKQAVAESAAEDRDIAAFYRGLKFEPIWVGPGETHRARRAALLGAMSSAGAHGLPQREFDPNRLRALMASARTEQERGELDVELTRTLLRFSRALQTGILTPGKVVSNIKRKVPVRDASDHLNAFTTGDPNVFFRTLVPTTPEYTRLVRAKMELEKAVEQGGWGQRIPASSLKPGQSGQSVVALRNRLISMGYLTRSASVIYDGDMQKAVQQFQLHHGLEPDGVAGSSTIRSLNVSALERLKSVMVAMERERWLNRPRGERYILVNLTDFSARIMDNDKETFYTRAVIGKNVSDRRTPEFSDVMEYMEINPYWNVPRSIMANEYLPLMRSNPYAVGHLEVVDGRGRVVPRSAVNFSAYSGRTFPFNLRQPPSNRNALGLVKFMFPNPYNIYLHDTPAKSLFAHEVRAYSHGCVRLHKPFEFGYALLARQTDDPVNEFQRILKSGANTRVNLEKPVPVHIIYRTAFTDAKGRMNYRADMYGRDALIFDALRNAGVALPSVRG